MQLSPAHQCMNGRGLEVVYAHSDSSSETWEKKRNETCCCFAHRLKSCCGLFRPGWDMAVWKRRNKSSLGLGFISAGAKTCICNWMTASRSYIPAKLIGMRDLGTCVPFAFLNKTQVTASLRASVSPKMKGRQYYLFHQCGLLGWTYPPSQKLMMWQSLSK